MRSLRAAIAIAALAAVLAAMPACASPGPAAPAPAGVAQGDSAVERELEQAKARQEALAAVTRRETEARAAEQRAAEQRAAAARAAAEAQMRREKEAAEAAAIAERAKAEAAARAAQQDALEVGQAATPEEMAGQNAAALALLDSATRAASATAPAAPAASTAPAEDAHKLVAEIRTSMGTLVIGFYPDDAPHHVQNFIDLARRGFYDGLRFHRIIPGFLVQGGDPKGDGTGGPEGPGYPLKAEWNSRLHVRGTVSMARLSHPDSARSQFFICPGGDADHDLHVLDGRYTVFGHVLRGFDVLDAIASVGSPSGVPSQPVTMLAVIIRPLQADDLPPPA